jgi:hypothetical protein
LCRSLLIYIFSFSLINGLSTGEENDWENLYLDSNWSEDNYIRFNLMWLFKIFNNFNWALFFRTIINYIRSTIIKTAIDLIRLKLWPGKKLFIFLAYKISLRTNFSTYLLLFMVRSLFLYLTYGYTFVNHLLWPFESQITLENNEIFKFLKSCIYEK